MALKEYVVNADFYIKADEDSEDNTDWPENVLSRLKDSVYSEGYEARFGELEEI